MAGFTLDFERPIVELEQKIQELKGLGTHKTKGVHLDLKDEIGQLEEKLQGLRQQVYKSLSAWQRVQMARHPKRPYTLDYIAHFMTDFIELHGDRLFSDDHALIGGFAKFEGRPIMIIGHQKGRDTKENLYRNFGSAHPEGYRKALRLMQTAGKFPLPVFCFIDTPGAYPGVGAEERGQAQAIATNLREMAKIPSPIVVAVIGEGGSGGALGIGVGDRILVMENAYYSVISPEGCAAILWKDRAKAPEAAASLKLTGPDLKALNLIDEVVPEPLGGAHRDPHQAAENLKAALKRSLEELLKMDTQQLLTSRHDKYRRMGLFTES